MTYENEYQLFFDHVNSLIERRKSVTTTYLSVNTAVTAAIAFLFKDAQLQGWTQRSSALILLVAGLVACTLWRRLIQHYSTMIGWWYGRLRYLEGQLQETSKSITEEYNQQIAPPGKVTTRLSAHELRLVNLFMIMYSLFSIGILLSLIFRLG